MNTIDGSKPRSPISTIHRILSALPLYIVIIKTKITKQTDELLHTTTLFKKLMKKKI